MMGRRNVKGIDLVPVLGLSQPQVAAPGGRAHHRRLRRAEVDEAAGWLHGPLAAPPLRHLDLWKLR